MGAVNSYNTEEYKNCKSTNLIFKSEEQIKNTEKYFILNFNKHYSSLFMDIMNYFCCNYDVMGNPKTANMYLVEVFGENFVKFLTTSDFFKCYIEDNYANDAETLAAQPEEFQDEKQGLINKSYIFNIKRLRLLVFLLTVENYVEEIEFHDRVSF